MMFSMIELSISSCVTVLLSHPPPRIRRNLSLRRMLIAPRKPSTTSIHPWTFSIADWIVCFKSQSCNQHTRIRGWRCKQLADSSDDDSQKHSRHQQVLGVQTRYTVSKPGPFDVLCDKNRAVFHHADKQQALSCYLQAVCSTMQKGTDQG